VDVLNNLVRDLGVRATQARRLVGIQATACTRIRIAGNRVVNVGPAEAQLRDVDAIAVIGLHEHAEVVDNSVQRQVIRTANIQDNSRWRAVRIGGDDVRNFAVGSALLVRAKSIEAWFTAERMFIRLLVPEAAGVRGNTLAGYGAVPLVQIASTGRILVSDNRVTLVPPDRIPLIVASASAAILNANYVDGARGDHDVVQLQLGRGPFTVLGNIATGVIRVNGAALPAPWKPLNVETA
jgi:hypothetical protein